MIDLVARVKAFQKRDPVSNHSWKLFANYHYNGTYDPSRYDKKTLQQFLAENEWYEPERWSHSYAPCHTGKAANVLL